MAGRVLAEQCGGCPVQEVGGMAGWVLHGFVCCAVAVFSDTAHSSRLCVATMPLGWCCIWCAIGCIAHNGVLYTMNSS